MQQPKRPATGRVRIIGGMWKGRKLDVATGVRPTPDRARVTLFNWLLRDLPGARVLDLFAGSGVLGLEALSRGAAHATLVEQNRAAAAALLRQCRTLGATADVHRGEALHWLAGQPPARRWNVIFLDPPFDAPLLMPALKAAAARLADDGTIYAESAAAFDLPAAAQAAGLAPRRTARAGDVAYAVLARSDAGHVP